MRDHITVLALIRFVFLIVHKAIYLRHDDITRQFLEQLPSYFTNGLIVSLGQAEGDTDDSKDCRFPAPAKTYGLFRLGHRRG